MELRRVGHGDVKNYAYPAAASSPIKSIEHLIRQRRFEVIRHDELTGAQANRSKRLGFNGMRRRCDYGERLFVLNDQQGFASRRSAEVSNRIVLNFLKANRCHTVIVTLLMEKKQALCSRPVNAFVLTHWPRAPVARSCPTDSYLCLHCLQHITGTTRTDHRHVEGSAC